MTRIIAYLAIRRQEEVCLSGSGIRQIAAQNCRMGNKIKELRKQKKVTIEMLAERTGYSTSFISRLQNSKRNVSLTHVAKIASALGVAPTELIESEESETVPLVGYVGAGSLATLFGLGQDPQERVEAPECSTEHTVAVEIRGTSLGALFDRWLIFYDDVRDPVDASLMRKLCVLGLRDGETILVKKIMPGSQPGLYTLTSNADEPILNADVAWAAKVKAMVPR